ncbi:MAG: flippase-like domain-containing protein [Bacteroidota bacterium]|nr:flippase-like domain-containing protein [Bacteroidota bacterium]MDX5431350.1 flippase-like domain-containing protein [Bacteroidota bacterium]MDX5470078.1 flippase-like domain-containing protein [Bacteroidota bacterium]
MEKSRDIRWHKASNLPELTPHTEAPKQFRIRNVVIPIVLGLAVTAYMVYREFDAQAYAKINWSFQVLFWLFMCLVMMAIRDLGYMMRIRILTEKKLSWKKAFDVIMLWEFASALSPSVVGGSGVAMFILNQEKIPLGKSTAIVLVTALLDELFYILMVPICILLAGWENLFPIELQKNLLGISLGIKGIFFAGYGFIFLLTFIILVSVFFNPKGFKNLLVRVFSLPVLRRFRPKAAEVGREVMVTSIELKGKNFGFWAKCFGATFLSWTARFLVINCLILAFVASADHFIIYARQMVMWVIMLISPTPGSSGIAEIVFEGFLKEFTLPNLAGFQAFLWRLLSYYPYLIIGIIVFPRWLRRVRGTASKEA